jgi:hypothetical protein
MSGVPDQKNGCGHAMAENDMYEPPCGRNRQGRFVVPARTVVTAKRSVCGTKLAISGSTALTG